MSVTRQTVSSGYPFEESYGYARAVRVGNQVFVTGTTARPPHLDGDAYSQLAGAIETIAVALEAAGAELRVRSSRSPASLRPRLGSKSRLLQ